MKNKLFTIGVEEEYMICDPNTYELVDRADQIMSHLDDLERARFSYELLLSEIESNTEICIDVNESIEEIIKYRNRLKTIGDKLNFKIGISGTHPTALPEDQNFVKNDSYNWVSSQLDEYARQNITFSTHVHIGWDDKDTIIRKVKRAVTDSGTEIVFSDDKPGLKNLINIYSHYSGISPQDIEKKYAGKMYSEFKEDLGEIISDALKPLRLKYDEIISEKDYLNNVLSEGSEKAGHLARKMLSKVYRKIGLIKK